MIHSGSHASFHCHYVKEYVHTSNDGRSVGGGQSSLSRTFTFGICTYFMKEMAVF